MKTRYIRNRIYLTQDEQHLIKEYPILLAGSGIGSVIAECALRFGFENITIIDGDVVELSNLNRQNYTENDINNEKVTAIKKRLLAINSKATITVHNQYLSIDNIEDYTKDIKIAVNALDFNTEVPLAFDRLCKKNNITLLHPYNLGWGGLVAAITPQSLSLESLVESPEKFNEIHMVKYVIGYLKFWGTPCNWLEEVLNDYLNEEEKLSPPQLSVGSWIVAGMCINIMFHIATNKPIKEFPEFYLSSIYE